jgi:hypothetical protein
MQRLGFAAGNTHGSRFRQKTLVPVVEDRYEPIFCIVAFGR